jgi:hypothetical protein
LDRNPGNCDRNPEIWITTPEIAIAILGFGSQSRKS